MEELQRVDIKVPKELLKFAAVKAAITGISRRQYIANIVIDTLEHVKAFSDAWDQVKDRPAAEREYPLSVTECTTTKPELDGYTVKKTHIGVMDAQQLRDKGVDVENLLEKGLLKKLE